MKKIILLTIIGLASIFKIVNAQPFTLKSTGESKSFQLKIYYGTQGKGAFVQYIGQSGIIPLKLISKKTSKVGKSIRTKYVWNEIIQGRINGSYGLTENEGKLSELWYKRAKNEKMFQLENVNRLESIDKYLLHGTLISFYHSMDSQLNILYPDGSKENMLLPAFDLPNPARKSIIADYNFDGYDDVAFSIPDAGMGVYRTFTIFLYEPVTKRFKKLADPNDSRTNCSGLCDVTLDHKNKLLASTCRGAATWWTDIYSFSKGNQLKWISSKKQ